MEVADDNRCDNCHNRHITTVADVWCSTCSERYCSSCCEYHEAFRATKNHKTISISDFAELPSSIKDIDTFCKAHNDTYQLYCQKHEQCCCPRCIKESHRGCTDIDVLSDVIKGVKTSTSLEDIEVCLKTINVIYEKVSDNRLQNICRLIDQKEKILKEIKDIKISVNRHIDNLLSVTEKSISAKIEAENLKINDVLKEVEKRRTTVTQLIEEEKIMKQLCTDLQTFLALPTFQKYIKEESQYIECLQDEHNVDEVDLKFEKSAFFASFREDGDSLGTISVSQNPSLVNFDVWKKQRAQNLLLDEEDFYEKAISKKIQIFYHVRKNKTAISGCTILPNGHLLFSDNNNGVLFRRTTDGGFQRDIDVKDIWDVAFIGNDDVAISTFNGKQVKILNTNSGVEIRTIPTTESCYGIEFVDEKYFIKARAKFLVLDKDGNVLSEIKNTSCLGCVTAKDDKIFGSNRELNTVECYNIDGTRAWKFENEKLKYPRDLTTDNDGFVYVVGKDSNNVVVISPDGKRCKELLNKSDGLNAPVAIHYEKTLDQLLVSNETSDAIVYEIDQ